MLTIIAVFMLIVIPAIQKSREGARRLPCQNNLKQLSFAVMQHVDRHGFYPGWRNEGPVTGGVASWPIVMLPFLERDDISRMIARGNPLPAVFVQSFNCTASVLAAQTGPTLAYAGNCGSGSNLHRADGVMLDTTITSGPDSGRRGLFDMKDGLSQTLIFSEKCGPGTAAAALSQAAWNEAIPLTTGTSIPGFSNGPNMYAVFGIVENTAAPPQIINSRTAGAPGFFSQPSSNHAGGVYAAFCDGAVVFLKDSLDGSVYAQLLSANDNACRADSSLYATYGRWTSGSAALKEGASR